MEDGELVINIGKLEGVCLDEKDDVLGLGSISFEVLKNKWYEWFFFKLYILSFNGIYRWKCLLYKWKFNRRLKEMFFIYLRSSC